MEQNIQRLSIQLQAMQQEVRELTQLAQQLTAQGMNQFQQWQGMGAGLQSQNQGQAAGSYYNLARNEQASLQLLHNLTEVCQEMNQHLRNISQQMSQAGLAQNNMTFQPHSGASGVSHMGGQNNLGGSMMQSGNSMSMQNQTQVPEGPVTQDTTHGAANLAQGNEQTEKRLTSQMDNNLLQGTGANRGFSANAQFAPNHMISNNLNQQMTAQNAEGTQGTQDTQMQSQQPISIMANQSNPNQMLQVPTEAQLKNNLNENREEPQATQYPYNRYTT